MQDDSKDARRKKNQTRSLNFHMELVFIFFGVICNENLAKNVSMEKNYNTTHLMHMKMFLFENCIFY